ncbi:MAG TPA: methyltransferase domain-containing protein [Gammaproteobacteria bacterium]|nr:methyltransferase domain-containing protein [Gammaproteobacteria bacterium]
MNHRRVDTHSLIHLTLSLSWESLEGRHCEVRHFPRFNVWRDLDLLPWPVRHAILDHEPGQSAAFPFEAGELVPAWREDAVRELAADAFRDRVRPDQAITTGRFYPRGLLQGVPGASVGDRRPARLIGRDGERLRFDLNHPLARIPLELGLEIVAVEPAPEERGGRCDDALEALSRGPGMQARHGSRPTEFFGDRVWRRVDEEPDRAFYRKPRMVHHLDATALAEVEGLHRRLLSPGSRVLDLMASWDSHLSGAGCDRVVGLGLNAEELEANPALGLRLCHDLNESPALPFEDATFDGVVCTASVEYLARPLEVFAEVARILKPGGLFLHTFSNRWFPTKAIRLWSELHEFERMGLVSEYFLATGRFAGLHTRSLRGLPRPANDPHIGETRLSDPVYAVWAYREGV